MYHTHRKSNSSRKLIASTIVVPLMLLLMSLFHTSLHAQAVEQLIQKKKYTFTVQTIQPFRGTIRQDMQTPGYYSVKITADSIISNLPFFGRAYTATIGSAESPLVFISAIFDYTIVDRKKGGWDITIKPKDIDKVEEMLLTVFPNGNASLRVISTSRDPISFEGMVGAKT